MGAKPTTRFSILLTREFFVALAASVVISVKPITQAWMHSPLDRQGPFMFALWCLAWFGLSGGHHSKNKVIYLSLFLSVASIITDIHALGYLAFVAALLGTRNLHWNAVTWAVSGTAWMPLTTWLFAKIDGESIQVLKWTLTVLGVAGVMLTPLLTRKTQRSDK